MVAAAALCAALLAGCDSIKDLRTEPYTDIPPLRGLLAGKITGLGTLRPVALSYDGNLNCLAPDPADPGIRVPSQCRFYGAQGQNEVDFSFGSFDVGSAYNITVQAQPFGKTCTVTNGSGTVGSGAPAPVVTCVNDSAVPRYDLTVSVPLELQAEPGLWVRLNTEDGVHLRNATGQASVVFDDVLFNSLSNLPAFAFDVTAYTSTDPDGASIGNRCTFVTSADFSVGGRNMNNTETRIPPTGPLAVSLAACSFTPTATVQYNGAPAQVMPGSGMELGLKNHLTGEIVEPRLQVAAFTAGPATLSYPASVRANSGAIYELVVTRHPDNMHCVVYGTTVTFADTTSGAPPVPSNITVPTGGAVLLVDPNNTDWWAYLSRAVRCRAIPAPENQLTGTYQMDTMVPTEAFPNPGRPREFLTFFADGTFLYGINANAASLTAGSPNITFPSSTLVRSNGFASSGVQHGFYNYNSVAGTIVFTVFTATNINPVGRGLTGMPGYAAFSGNVTASNVVKTAPPASTLSFTFTAGANTRLWTMTEPESLPGEITGTWVTPDHRRMFIYNKNETFAFHAGVNGMGNMQDVCMLVLDGYTQSEGFISKHAGSASSGGSYTCTPGRMTFPVSPFAPYNTRTPDLPHYAPKNGTPSLVSGITTPRIAPGFRGRFPGTASQLDNRPTSPAIFEVVPGTGGDPDTLVVQNTLNGVPIDEQITFVRQRAN